MDIVQRHSNICSTTEDMLAMPRCTSTGLTTLNIRTPSGVSSFYTVCVQASAGTPPDFTVKSDSYRNQTA